jgi:tetratricopeptide (TPR) repeat protein
MKVVCLNLLFLILLILVLDNAGWSQSATQDSGVLRPPSPKLGPVYWPNLANLEDEVREQLTAAQLELSEAVKDRNSAPSRLSEAYGNLGEIYHAYSLAAPARECYLNASLLAPEEFRWIYFLGKLAEQEGRFTEAISNYQAARSRRPDYLAAAVSLGNLYLQLNRLSDAERSFAGALKIQEKNAAALYGLGQVALSERRYAAAVAHFEEALVQSPGANRLHYSLAMAYRGLGDSTQVKLHLAQQGSVGVRAADPLVDGLQDLVRGERVYLARGKLAYDARRYEEAAAEFRRALAAKPNGVTARLNLGAALLATRNFEAAREQFAKVLQAEPANVVAQFNLGVLEAEANRPEAAITHLRALLNAVENDNPARLLLAQQLAKTGRADEALIEFKRLAEADPESEAALLGQVKVLLSKRRYQAALELLEKSHSADPQRGLTTVMLAELLVTAPQIELRDGRRGLELAQRAFDATGLVSHGVLVARALAELGRCEEAATWQRRMIEAAQKQGHADVVNQLKPELERYEHDRPCRPPINSLTTAGQPGEEPRD